MDVRWHEKMLAVEEVKKGLAERERLMEEDKAKTQSK